MPGDKGGYTGALDEGIIVGAPRYALRYSRPLTGNASVRGEAGGIVIEADDVFLAADPLVTQPPPGSGFSLGVPAQDGPFAVRVPLAIDAPPERAFKVWSGSEWV